MKWVQANNSREPFLNYSYKDIHPPKNASKSNCNILNNETFYYL